VPGAAPPVAAGAPPVVFAVLGAGSLLEQANVRMLAANQGRTRVMDALRFAQLCPMASREWQTLRKGRKILLEL
jgi:hypothetical protein